MQLCVITWKNAKKLFDKWEGSKSFLVKDYFDDADALSKVKKQILPQHLPDSTFEIKKIVFNDFNTYSL